MKIYSERLFCEPGQPDEFNLYYLLARNQKVMHHITGKSISKETARKRFDAVLEKRVLNPEIGYYWVRDRHDNTFIGLVKLEHVEAGVLELGYSLLPEFWGKGYTSEIVGEVIKYTRSLHHLHKLIAIVDPENGPSKAILEKYNFVMYKKGLYQKRPAEYYFLKLT